ISHGLPTSSIHTGLQRRRRSFVSLQWWRPKSATQHAASATATASSVILSKGLSNAWKSTGAETGRVVFLFTPARAGKAFEELQRLQRPVGSTAASVFQRHGAEVVGPPPF